MYKKRLKGLLAMVLAGSIAMTALPITVSATINDTITIKGGDLDGGTIDPNDIGPTSFSAGVLHDNTTYLTANNLWAVYSNWGDGLSSGIISTTVPGNQLAQTLYDYHADSSKAYTGTKIKYTHDLAFTTEDLSDSSNSVENADLTSYTVSAFPYDISNVISGTDVGPLKEITSWTAWYNRDSGNFYNPNYNYAGNCTKINETPKKITENISADIVGAVFNCSDSYASDAFYYGKTIIQLNADYKTFKIPVYDGLGKATNEVVPVTYGNTEPLIPEEATAALKGIYILVYDKDSDNTKVSGWLTDKADLWEAIEDVAAEYSEFVASKARLVRDVTYNISESAKDGSTYIGDYSSLDLLNGVTTNTGKQYFDTHSASGDNIWKARTSHDYVAYTDDVNATITYILDISDAYTITLTNMANIAVTAEKPEVGTKIPESDVYDYPVSKYPAATDSIAAYLTGKVSPTAGYKYDTDNWTLWDFGAESGAAIKNNIPVSDNSKIGIDEYKNIRYQYAAELLVYFPQTELTASVKVPEPAAGAAPAAKADLTVNDDSTVTAVKWFNGNTELADGDKFKAGKQYTIKVTLKAKDGLQFIATTPTTIATTSDTANPTPVTPVYNAADSTLTVSYTFDAIPSIGITAADLYVTAPKLGKAPDTKVDLHDGVKFTVSEVSWSVDGTKMTDGEKFKAGTQYTVSAKLTADEGYSFTENTIVKVNNNPATTKTLNNDGTLTVSYTFSKLSSRSPYVPPYRPVNEKKPANTEISKGWSNITSEIKAAAIGSTIKITLNDETTMPEAALSAAIDRKVKLVLAADFDRIWTIDGATAVPGKDIDLTVSGVNVDLPAESYRNIRCSSSNQLLINSRMLNFTAQLSEPVGKYKAGQNAAIYLYNDQLGRLLFQELSVVDKDGNVTFDVQIGGKYFIALGNEVKAPSAKCGDVNGDGTVNAFDASAILMHEVFGYPINKSCADSNSDGKINAFDAAAILKYAAGLINALPDSAA